MLRRWLAVPGALVAAVTIAYVAPALGQGLTPRYGVAEGLRADVTYLPTNLPVTVAPTPAVSIGPAPATVADGVLNFNVPAGADAFEAAEMFVATDSNFSDRVESSATLSDFDLIGFRGDQIVTDCTARANSAGGTTTLTNVFAGPGNQLPENPAPNTVIEFTPSSFTVHLNEQQVTSGAGGSRIEITAMRVVFQAGDYSGSFSFGHVVCDFGANAPVGTAPTSTATTASSTTAPNSVALQPTFTG